jgi:putative flavoprotein involved in K+ transport
LTFSAAGSKRGMRPRYKGQEYLVRKLFGADVAERVGAIWGFGDGQELRSMFARTPQPGLWFIAGSLAQCRIYSKHLAVQIKASELEMPGSQLRAPAGPGRRRPVMADRSANLDRGRSLTEPLQGLHGQLRSS